MTTLPKHDHTIDQALVHHFIRVHGRPPAPYERRPEALLTPGGRRWPGLAVRRTVARWIWRL